MKGLSQLAIGILAVVSLGVSYKLDSSADGWWQSLLQNFGAGLCSALVLIWLYDQVLDFEAQKIKNERNRIAAEQLVVPLRSHIYGLLFPMYRSAVAQKPENEIKNWKEFLIEKFPKEMPRLDISFMSPGSYPEITPYPQFISEGLSEFLSKLHAFLNKYGTVVDADLVEAVEHVINSKFLIFGCHMEQTANFIPPNFPASYSFEKNFKFDSSMCADYGVKLSNLIEAVECKLPRKISEFEDQYWHNANLGIGYARR